VAIDPNLKCTLDVVAEAAGELREPWWIIGSAAAVLVGLLDEPVADVDLLTDGEGARQLLRHWDFQAATPSPSPLFASEVFGRISVAPLPIEIMGGLHVRGNRFVPSTRMPLRWKDRQLFVPDLPEQIAILRLFGRAKDLQRAERLSALL
jgi:hypothetical protein